jgi:aquaporin TIP
MAKFTLGHHREVTEAGCVRAVLAEAVLTFLFVFSGVGSAMAAGTYACTLIHGNDVHACMCSI